MGQTSEAYAGAIVAKIPHGIPHKICPMRSTVNDGAKKGIKTNATMDTSETRRTLRYPNL
jgi:hypothetical protein